jgi:hypothetical protein
MNTVLEKQVSSEAFNSFVVVDGVRTEVLRWLAGMSSRNEVAAIIQTALSEYTAQRFRLSDALSAHQTKLSMPRWLEDQMGQLRATFLLPAQGGFADSAFDLLDELSRLEQLVLRNLKAEDVPDLALRAILVERNRSAAQAAEALNYVRQYLRD